MSKANAAALPAAHGFGYLGFHVNNRHHTSLDWSLCNLIVKTGYKFDTDIGPRREDSKECEGLQSPPEQGPLFEPRKTRAFQCISTYYCLLFLTY